MSVFDRRMAAHIDWLLMLITIVICAAGLLVLYSAGYDPETGVDLFGFASVDFASAACLKQAVYVVAGLVVMAIAMSIPTQFFFRSASLLYVGSLLLLVAVAAFGVVVNGSRRWLDVGVFNLQPAEFMKFALIVAMARRLARKPPEDGKAYRLGELFVPMIIIAVPMGLIMQQPDLGTALSLGLVGVAQILFVGVRPKALITVLSVLAVLAYPSWLMLHDYQQRRILVLLNPESDPQGSGYHITQSKIAVGSGELFGKGFQEGTQSQLEFLPEHTTDFVFSVLAEEWGFVGSVSIIVLFFFLLSCMLRVAGRARDLFSSLVALGITAQFFAHIVINIGMVIGLMPVVGIPLPLVSYGGSAMLSLMFGLGVLQGVSMRRQMFGER
jgi:rod shape determining protein RodA